MSTNTGLPQQVRGGYSWSLRLYRRGADSYSAGHPHVHIKALTGDSQAGKDIADIYPHLRFKDLPKLVTIAQVDFSKIDLAFLLPAAIALRNP